MKKHNHSLKPRLEVLEDRRLMAILLGPDGTLYAHGTDSAEQIRVTEGLINVNPATPFVRVLGITVTRDDKAGNILESFSFRASRVSSLNIAGLGGSDILVNNTALPATINAGSGLDFVSGGSGKDVITGGNNADILIGNGGDDVLAGGAGADVLFGGLGNDSLNGAGGADWLLGGSGDDSLNGNGGADFLFGDTPAFGTLETLAEDMGVLVPNNFSAQFLDDGGSAGDDILFGSSGNDVLFGEEGEDELHGGTGNDLMFGGLGTDTMAGGAGSDAMDKPDILPDELVAADVEVNKYIFEIGDSRVRYQDGLGTWTMGALFHIGPPVGVMTDGPYDGHFVIII